MHDFFKPELSAIECETVFDAKTRKDLELYISGENHNCIFKTSKIKEEPSKSFKCHKDILMRESKMLETILTSLSGDIEVTFHIHEKVSAAALDLCMKFIYGDLKDFKSIALACEVFYFARKWQLSRLEDAAKSVLSNPPTNDLLKVFELYLGLENQTGMDALSEVIGRKIGSIVETESWYNAPVAVLEHIFQLQHLRMREVDLFVALVRWCRDKSKEEGADESSMRPQVDKLVRLVRFRCMSRTEFTAVCVASSTLLTRDEKYEIIVGSNLDLSRMHLPLQFAPQLHPRNLSERTHSVSWSNNNTVDATVGGCRMSFSAMSFQMKEGATCLYLSGLHLSCQHLLQVGEVMQLLVTVYGNVNNDVELYSAEVVLRHADDAQAAAVNLQYPLPLRGRHFYTVKVEYLTIAPFPCKVFYMTPLSRHLRDVFLNLYGNSNHTIVDICGLELRRELESE